MARRELLSLLLLISWIARRVSFCLCRPGRSLQSDARPRASMSCVFCLRVPTSKCAGFTHGGLLHECRTTMPRGIGPLNRR